MNISRSALGGSSTASLPRKSNFWSLRSCALTNSSMHDGLCVPGMRQFLARPRRQLYWVGICGTCHDDIAAAYHSCCVKASEDEQDALLLVGYIYGSLHGTPDCQALMARSYDDGNPFRISHVEGKYDFKLPPTYGGNYTFTANLKKCRTFIKVVLDDGARKVYGPPDPTTEPTQWGRTRPAEATTF